MKKKYNAFKRLNYEKLLNALYILAFTLFCNGSFSQTTSAFWPLNFLKKDSPTIVTGCMIPNPMVIGSEFTTNPFSTSTGFRCRPFSTIWCKIPTNNFNVDFIVKPTTGLDIRLDTIALNAYNNSGVANFYISIYYKIDSSATWTQILNSPQKLNATTGLLPIKFSALNLPIYSGHTYTFRMYMYNTDATSKSNYLSIQAISFKGF